MWFRFSSQQNLLICSRSSFVQGLDRLLHTTTMVLVINSKKPASGLSKLLITNHHVATFLFVYMEHDGDDDDDDDDGADVAPAA